MSQLALAHERGLIASGASLRLVAEQDTNYDLTKDMKNQSKGKIHVPTIKLQLIKQGKKKQEYVDINLDGENIFTS